ncbi:hypothetical protein GE09DRAFT_1089297 [Coniochaeta sp. 2T2.1]|nr:hypothetical protein GE09DRAFT_1089297 [Coniochaeta sp. 2T2.1]
MFPTLLPIMMITLVLTLCFSFIPHPGVVSSVEAASLPRKLTWDNLVAEMPETKKVLLYCNTINRNAADCAETFLGHGADVSRAGTSYVSRAAAHACLDKFRTQTERLDALYELFDVDLDAMAARASGGNNAPKDKFNGNTYSDAARSAAGSKAWNELVPELEAKNKLRNPDKSSDPIFGGRNPDDRFPDGEEGFALGLVVLEAYELATAYRDASEDPSSVGVAPDLDCHGSSCRNAAGQHTDPHGNPTPEPKEPEPWTPEPETEPPEFEPTEPEVFEPILQSTEPLEDMLLVTPMLRDETFKSAMERCQEDEERKLWRSVGAKTIDPDAILDDEMTMEDAEDLLRRGVCDIGFYGAAFCKNWKEQRDSTPVPPEWKDDFAALKQYSPLCPVNLYEPEACKMAEEEIRKRYAWPELLDGMFEPGPPVPWLPGRKMDPLDRKAVQAVWTGVKSGGNTILGSRASTKKLGAMTAAGGPGKTPGKRDWLDGLGKMAIKAALGPNRGAKTGPKMSEGHDEL